ncbi:MAG: SDR family NAD(P)-dependent oxidoreductase [Gammaproteobacteria bacterium]|jgi:short-subunit dehydrogenase
MELSGKNVVITGGSQGIGETLAERFAKGGAKVLLVARSQAKLEALSKKIGAEYLVADHRTGSS